MNLNHRNPWTLMNGLSREIDRLFETRYPPQARVAESRWVPAIDIRELADRYVVTADLPGMQPDEIEITLEDGVLTIAGERSRESNAGEQTLLRAERLSGQFERRFRLVEADVAEAPEAEYRNGVLSVTIPKQKRPEPQRIEITTH